MIIMVRQMIADSWNGGSVLDIPFAASDDSGGQQCGCERFL